MNNDFWPPLIINIAPLLVLGIILWPVVTFMVRRHARTLQANRSFNAQHFERQNELSQKQLEISERSSQALLALLERIDQRIARLEDKP